MVGAGDLEMEMGVVSAGGWGCIGGSGGVEGWRVNVGVFFVV